MFFTSIINIYSILFDAEEYKRISDLPFKWDKDTNFRRWRLNNR